MIERYTLRSRYSLRVIPVQRLVGCHGDTRRFIFHAPVGVDGDTQRAHYLGDVPRPCDDMDTQGVMGDTTKKVRCKQTEPCNLCRANVARIMKVQPGSTPGLVQPGIPDAQAGRGLEKGIPFNSATPKPPYIPSRELAKAGSLPGRVIDVKA